MKGPAAVRVAGECRVVDRWEGAAIRELALAREAGGEARLRRSGSTRPSVCEVDCTLAALAKERVAAALGELGGCGDGSDAHVICARDSRRAGWAEAKLDGEYLLMLWRTHNAKSCWLVKRSIRTRHTLAFASLPPAPVEPAPHPAPVGPAPRPALAGPAPARRTVAADSRRRRRLRSHRRTRRSLYTTSPPSMIVPRNQN